MDKMAMTPKGFKLFIIGLLVMILGYVLMIGGGSDDPNVFNYAMFDFRRLVLAPAVILVGIVIEIIAIMNKENSKEEE
ncbi:MAG: DUF3098 domain-containing protein [Bacteroidales bacterium]|nr:DUF3098 domain-containing protein [Bacteroidales bacterium]